MCIAACIFLRTLLSLRQSVLRTALNIRSLRRDSANLHRRPRETRRHGDCAYYFKNSTRHKQLDLWRVPRQAVGISGVYSAGVCACRKRQCCRMMQLFCVSPPTGKCQTGQPDDSQCQTRWFRRGETLMADVEREISCPSVAPRPYRAKTMSLPASAAVAVYDNE